MSDFAYPLHEECGVFGIYDRAGTEDVAAAAYSALYALQHRGQESCGIAVNDDGVIVGHRDLGLVNEVFTPAVLASLANPNAHMATGHVRYATAGSRVRANAQPMIVRHGRGTMALCHNGNLTNAIELRRQLENEGAIFHGSSDTEVICYLITRNRLRMGSIETAISKTMDVLEGAYSLVIMSATKLIADVAGKGVPAAIFMAISRTVIRTIALTENSAAMCMQRSNTFLCQENVNEMFVTAFYGILNLNTGLVTYCNAGHNPPVLMKADNTVVSVPLTNDFILGGVENMTYHEKTLQLSPGDNLLLYTDGITEAMNTCHEQYSEKRLLENCRELIGKSPKEIVDRITETVGKFVVGAVQSDDITLLSITYQG